MGTIFMNFENSKISEWRVLILKFTDKLDLKKVKKMLLYQTLVLLTDGKT